MKVYIPAIVGYVPDNMVLCLSAFLDACYITQCQEIDTNALDALSHALDWFWKLCEIFRIPGIRPTGFSLPRQHALTHYQTMIEDFGVPGGLCSSITESHHITAVQRPWHRSNRYHALGQMLLTNQHLDKLAAMHVDFTSHRMIRGVDTVGRNIPPPPGNAQALPNGSGDDNNDNKGPVDENISGHVVLAQTHGMFYSLYRFYVLMPRRAPVSSGYRGTFPLYKRALFALHDTGVCCRSTGSQHRQAPPFMS
jgi:hypothetical protein